MLLFCPSCSNTLIITPLRAEHMTPDALRHGRAAPGLHRFQCRTCPYEMLLERPYYERKTFSNKAVEEVLGGEGSWKNVDRTEVNCQNPSCESKSAYFRQVQIRSADEPSTSFFKCVECGTEWREN